MSAGIDLWVCPQNLWHEIVAEHGSFSCTTAGHDLGIRQESGPEYPRWIGGKRSYVKG